jgi:hypothetical protein
MSESGRHQHPRIWNEVIMVLADLVTRYGFVNNDPAAFCMGYISPPKVVSGISAFVLVIR